MWRLINMIDSQTTVSIECKPQRRVDVTVHELDDEALIYDATTADTHRLNTTALFIWQQCDGQQDVQQIAQRLADTYDVPLESAREHVEKVLHELQNKRLIEDD